MAISRRSDGLVVLMLQSGSRAYRNSCQVYWDRLQNSQHYCGVTVPLIAGKPPPHEGRRASDQIKGSTGGCQLAFVIGEHDLDAAVLRPTPLRRVSLDRILVAVAQHFEALLVDAQIDQHVGHRLGTIA